MSICDVFARNLLKCLVEVELQVAHLEVVSSDLQVAREHSVLDCVSALPLSAPEGVQLDI